MLTLRRPTRKSKWKSHQDSVMMMVLVKALRSLIVNLLLSYQSDSSRRTNQERKRSLCLSSIWGMDMVSQALGGNQLWEPLVILTCTQAKRTWTFTILLPKTNTCRQGSPTLVSRKSVFIKWCPYHQQIRLRGPKILCSPVIALAEQVKWIKTWFQRLVIGVMDLKLLHLEPTRKRLWRLHRFTNLGCQIWSNRAKTSFMFLMKEMIQVKE